MENVRIHGRPPYRAAVLHGGPGAPGETGPVAKELSVSRGVLEPLQTAGTIKGQIRELKAVLENAARFPIVLIGYSWGALLGFLFAAHYPADVRKLILVSCPPFESSHAANINETRLNRLSGPKKAEAAGLLEQLARPSEPAESDTFMRLAELCGEADAFDPIETNSCIIDYQIGVFHSIWKEAEALRRSGKLLSFGDRIACPVTAVHGVYDPHPAEGVEISLSRKIERFRMIRLEKCGHKPWIEKHAGDDFYRVLNDELREDSETLHGFEMRS